VFFLFSFEWNTKDTVRTQSPHPKKPGVSRKAEFLNRLERRGLHLKPIHHHIGVIDGSYVRVIPSRIRRGLIGVELGLLGLRSWTGSWTSWLRGRQR